MSTPDLVMALTSLGSTRVGQITTNGLRFAVSAVALGTDGFDTLDPSLALPLVASDTALGTEILRVPVPPQQTAVETIVFPRGRETTYTSISGQDLPAPAMCGELGLFATIMVPGTSGLPVGQVFLLAHAHFPRTPVLPTTRLATRWPIDYSV